MCHARKRATYASSIRAQNAIRPRVLIVLLLGRKPVVVSGAGLFANESGNRACTRRLASARRLSYSHELLKGGAGLRQGGLG